MRTILILLGVLCSSMLFAQKNDMMIARDYTKGTYLTFGYHRSDFLNANYRDNLNEKIIKQGFGYYLGFKKLYNPFIFEGLYYSSKFRVKGLNPNLFPEETPVTHRGLEASILFNLFPGVKRFHPVAGVGFQLGEVSTIADKEKKIPFHNSGVYSGLFKVGFDLFFTRSFGMDVQYKRSINANYSKDNYQISAGLFLFLNFNYR